MPLRVLAVAYTDLLRGVPTLLVVVIFALGIPALKLQGLTNSFFWLTTFALVLSYGAYVAEVVRAGIDSLHPSQIASAEALALSRAQSMRYVVLPQALRRVVPPLMNDFVSLQKDTALVSAVGVTEALYAAAGLRELQLQLHAAVRRGRLLRGDDCAAREAHRLAERACPPAGTGWGMTELLPVEDLRKSYGAKVVLSEIDLTVNAHDVICLIGASGSGKSTLLRCLNLLETIDDGTITFAGREVSDPLVDPRDVRREIGMVFQAYNLFPHLTVLDNCMLAPVKVHGVTQVRRAWAGVDPARAVRARRQGGRRTRTHCPEVSSSARQWCGRCAPSRGCCCSTRSPLPSTPSSSARCWRSSGRRRRPG